MVQAEKKDNIFFGEWNHRMTSACPSICEIGSFQSGFMTRYAKQECTIDLDILPRQNDIQSYGTLRRHNILNYSVAYLQTQDAPGQDPLHEFDGLFDDLHVPEQDNGEVQGNDVIDIFGLQGKC